MDTSVVLDTSVIIKWFRQREVLAGQALALREAYLDGQILVLVPSLLAYELANVLRYKRDLTTAQVEDAVQSLFDMGLEWMPPSATMMRRAVTVAYKWGITVYDAAFVDLAESHSATFITADEQLARRLDDLPFVRYPGDLGEG